MTSNCRLVVTFIEQSLRECNDIDKLKPVRFGRCTSGKAITSNGDFLVFPCLPMSSRVFQSVSSEDLAIKPGYEILRA